MSEKDNFDTADRFWGKELKVSWVLSCTKWRIEKHSNISLFLSSFTSSSHYDGTLNSISFTQIVFQVCTICLRNRVSYKGIYVFVNSTSIIILLFYFPGLTGLLLDYWGAEWKYKCSNMYTHMRWNPPTLGMENKLCRLIFHSYCGYLIFC